MEKIVSLMNADVVIPGYVLLIALTLACTTITAVIVAYVWGSLLCNQHQDDDEDYGL